MTRRRLIVDVLDVVLTSGKIASVRANCRRSWVAGGEGGGVVLNQVRCIDLIV